MACGAPEWLYDALLAVQVPMCAAMVALHSLSNLPECMTEVSLVDCSVGLIDTRAVNEGGECSLIDPLVDVDATNHTLQVASGFCQLVLTGDGLIRLLVQKPLDLLGPGQLLGERCGLCCSSGTFINQHLGAVFSQPGFQDFSRETLMHPDAAAAALIATSLMWLPVLVIVCPRFAAAVHQLLFVLLCLFALVPGCLLVHTVHVVGIDLAESVDSMFVNKLVVLIQGLLPFFLLGIIEGFCLPFPMQPGQLLVASF